MIFSPGTLLSVHKKHEKKEAGLATALPPLGNVEVSKNRRQRSDDNRKDVGGEVASKVIRRIAKPFNDEGSA